MPCLVDRIPLEDGGKYVPIIGRQFELAPVFGTSAEHDQRQCELNQY
jgi:hypothetical protein